MAASAPSGATRDAVERVISVLCLLLHHERGRTRAQLRREVDGYQGLADAPFEKRFAWDRQMLTDLGVTLHEDDADEDQPRFRVDRGALTLPRLDFDEPERRALELAATVWDDDSLRRDVARAVGLLVEPSGTPPEQAVMPRVVPRATPRLEPLMTAAVEKSCVRFDYRDAQGTGSHRSVRAWATLRVNGQWYLAGWDLDRQAERLFRLSRIDGEPRPVPGGPRGDVDPQTLPGAEFSVRAIHDRLVGEPDQPRTLTVWAAPGRGQAVRVAGVPAPVVSEAPPATGWEAFEIPAPAHDGLEEMLGALLGRALPAVGHAPERERLHRWWEQAAALHRGDPTPDVLAAASALAPPRRGRNRASSLDWAARFLDIVGIANRAGGVTRAELRERFGLSEAELTTHLDLLRFCGLPERYYAGWLFDVVEDGDMVRIEQAEDFDAPLRLTRPEAHRLLAGLQAVAQMPHHDARLTPAAHRAARKIDAALLGDGPGPGPAGEGRREASDAGPSVPAGDLQLAGVADPADPAIPQSAPSRTGDEPATVAAFWDVDADPDLVRLLSGAVDHHRVLRLTYHSVHRDEESDRVVEPIELVQDGPRLYLTAWCRTAGDRRTFRVARITRPASTGEVYEPGRRHRRRAETRPTPERTDLTAVMRFAHRVADVADGYAPQREAVLADGSRLVEIGLTDASVAHALAGAHGGDVEVVAPAGLRAETHDRLLAALSALGRGAEG